MSSYENYDETSASYDETRKPVGLAILLGCLALGPKRLDEITVLDAGCGTGNYSRALLPHVGRIEAVDLSRGMIDQAAAKLAADEETGRIALQVASLTELPYEDASVDAVMVNQVLHHLDLPVHRRVLAEFHRVLRPGGVLVVNTCSHEQLRHGYWFFSLVPEAVEKMCLRYVPLANFRRLLEETGFHYGGRLVPTEETLQGEAYFDVRGPLRKAWRDGDSTWTLATPAEIERTCRRIREMDAEATLEDYRTRHDARRVDVGQTTFLYAIR